MPESITKLANPLPLITLPTAFPNGAPANWSTDPYLENNSAWTSGDVVALKNIGINRAQNGVSITLLSKTLADGLLPAYYYYEIVKLNGTIETDAGGNNASEFGPCEPGNYIVEFYGSSNGAHSFAFRAAGYIYDPTFKYVGLNPLPFGNLPLVADAANPAWCTGTVAGAAVKQSDGNIALDMSQSIGVSKLTWKCGWSASQEVTITVTVIALPIGGELAILGAGGATALLITEPGVYTVRTTLGAGEYPTVANNTSVPGNAIISRMMASRITGWRLEQPPKEGPLFAQIKCFFFALKTVFNAIIYPTTVFASASSIKPNLNGFVPPPGQPLLGYGSMPPPSGQFRVGDTVRNNNAIAGAVSGWRCITAGNPGTWMPLATL